MRAEFGIEWTHLSAGDVGQRLSPPEWALRDGAGLAGVLALFADSTLGGALSSLVPATRIPVTQSIRLDVVGSGSPPTAGDLVATARSIARSGALLISAGELASADGTELAVATMRSVVIDLPRPTRRGTGSPPAETAADTSPDTSAPSWAGYLVASGSRLEVSTEPNMANAARLVHGGVSMMLLETVARSAALERVGAVDPSTLSFDFVGPLPCDGGMFTCEATVAVVRGSTAIVHATASDADGRPAVVGTLSYRVLAE